MPLAPAPTALSAAGSAGSAGAAGAYGAGSGLAGLSNAGHGLGAILGSGAQGTAARQALMSALPYGKLSLAMAGAPAIAAMATPQKALTNDTKPMYYIGANGGYNGTGEVVYHPGTWNPDYHQGQAALTGQGFGPGVYSETYPGMPTQAPQPTLGAKAGGAIHHYDQGGLNSFVNQMNQNVTPTGGTQASGDLNNFINSYNQSVMPVANPKPVVPAKVPSPGKVRPDFGGGRFGGMNFGDLLNNYSAANSVVPNPNSYGNKLVAEPWGNAADYKAGGMLNGDGDGMSDSIPAVITGPKPQRAALADGEFVVPADVVSHLGNGSTNAGAKRLYAMMDKVRQARTGSKKQGTQINASKYMPA